MAERGRYLFAVARGIDGAAVQGTAGLRGAPLEVVEHRGLCAVVCDVDLADFGEEALARNLEDLAWLEEVARAHDEVVRAVAGSATVAPMRLVTICSDDASVRARIEQWYDGLTAALDRVQGRREWSVKAFAAREAQSPAPATTGAGSGAAYLQRKREQAAARRAAGDRSVEAAEAIHQALAATAVANRRLPPQDPRLTGREETMILNGAYLVPVEDGEAFVSAVEEIGGRHPGVQIEVGGPWPPYSFAVLD
jgi:hypothetical protein